MTKKYSPPEIAFELLCSQNGICNGEDDNIYINLSGIDKGNNDYMD